MQLTSTLRIGRSAIVAAICLLHSQIILARSGDERNESIDFGAARIVVSEEANTVEKNAVKLLAEEIAARTRLRLTVTTEWPSDSETPIIAVGRAEAMDNLAGRFAEEVDTGARDLPAEGFRIKTKAAQEGGGVAPSVHVIGNDSRGVLYGAGKLLRSLDMSRDRVELRAPLNVVTAPALPIRGHQLGYRPKTNSYDAWDLRQWEQYIRDLAVFGCNAIELIPPRSDDDADSPHFPLPQIEMIAGVSQLAADYGLDVWIWYPAMETRYATQEAIDAALKEWGDVLKKLPRVNALFVPSGDPGNVPPKELMAMLAQQAKQLERLHPGARIWISMQSFTRERFDEMMRTLDDEPEWLGGIVHGPQTRVSIAELRERLTSRYPIRGYPDITHSMRCEYPVPDWDLAYVLTEAREVINPRPLDQTNIFRLYRDHTRGVITYSEGCNDDVNKAIWSRLCWDPHARATDTLRDYSRYFIGPEYADDFAQGLMALERNWRGPLISNGGVETTLQQLRAMEKKASPRTLRNWRFQQALYRAYYDAYQRRRLIRETAQETQAMSILANARPFGTAQALDDAEKVLDGSDGPNEDNGLRDRIHELAEALFQSIGMQLSVEKYAAIDVGRGANLDTLDVPLNNRTWLKARFEHLRTLTSESEKLSGIDEILHWTDPGPGGFYDDLGDPTNQPHLVGKTFNPKDPGYLKTPTIGFRSENSWRRSWCTHVDGLYETPVTMRYSGLDPKAHYKLRIVYAGDNFEAKVRLVAVPGSSGQHSNDVEIHPFQQKPYPVAPVEYEIPAEAISSGELTLTWMSNPDRGGPGRGCQIAEVWLIKQPSN
jgi:hypothetical protein